MRKLWLALVTAGAICAQEQQPAPAPGGGGGNVPGGNPGGVERTAPTPSPSPFPGRTQQPGVDPNDPRNRQQFPEMQRPIFLSGKVMLEDGTPPPEPVVIERVCNGNPRPEGYTDSKGRFSFQLGQNQHMMADASVSNGPDGFDNGGFGGQQRGGSSPFGGPGGGRQITERDLMGCELRATLAGYRSEVVNLAGRRMMDNPDVGTIILRRLAGVEGFTTSMTTVSAPKDARKSYEKSRELLKKKKVAEAQKELEKAVGVYPKYAVAWFDLGRVHQESNRLAEAKDAYGKAIEADNKYVNPYLQLAVLAAGEQKWQEVSDHSGRVIKLNPVDFPQAFFYHSVANYNLQKYDEAEKSAQEAVKLDTRHRIPKAQHLLGMLLAMKDDYKGAAEHMRGYLQFAPQAQDADVVRKQLTDIEQRLGKAEVGQQK